jgi:hypothetical protein
MRTTLLLLLLPLVPAFSQQHALLDTEYHVVLTIDDKQYQLEDSDQIPDNQVISIAFPAHMVELRISLRDANTVMVETAIFEYVDEKWSRMKNDESGGFGGHIGALQTFEWTGIGVGLGISFKASMVNEQA